MLVSSYINVLSIQTYLLQISGKSSMNCTSY